MTNAAWSSRAARVCLIGLVALGVVPSSVEFTSAAPADVSTKEIQFTHGDTVVQGVVGWNNRVKGKRPAVLVIHSAWGYNDHVRERVRQLAEAGYVGYAFDMGGGGPVETHLEHGEGMSRQSEDNPMMRAVRFNMAIDQIKRDPHVDPDKISAIGYCWGGWMVLNMARAGADLDAVVTFHGILTTKNPARRNGIKPKILVLTGGQDPFVPLQAIEAFRKEMTDANASFEIVTYPGVKHAFTEPYAKNEMIVLGGVMGPADSRGAAYSEEADRQSWAAMLKLFKEVYP